MALAPWLLDLLVCPSCRARVAVKADGSGIKCVACHRVYPVREGIPVMLISEAVVEPPEPRSDS